jgi:hypothetical protein
MNTELELEQALAKHLRDKLAEVLNIADALTAKGWDICLNVYAPPMKESGNGGRSNWSQDVTIRKRVQI